MIESTAIIISIILSLGALFYSIVTRLNDIKHIKEDIECLYEKYNKLDKKLDAISDAVSFIKGKMDGE